MEALWDETAVYIRDLKTRTARAFQNRLGDSIQRALGMSLERSRFHAEIPGPRRPDIRAVAIFCEHIELLGVAPVTSVLKSEGANRPDPIDQARSNRSRSMTLAQAATKSFTNFSFESSHP